MIKPALPTMLFLSVATALAPAPLPAAATAYRSYVNARYGYAVCYPAFMASKPEAPNGDGRTFAARGGAGKLVVFGRNNPDGASLADTVRDDAADLAGQGGRITYRAQKADWAVFSGTSGAKTFYSKTIQRGDHFVIFELTYPTAASARYEPMVENLLRCFRTVR